MTRTSRYYCLPRARISYDHVAFTASENAVGILVSNNAIPIAEGGTAESVCRLSLRAGWATAAVGMCMERLDLGRLTSLTIDSLDVPLASSPLRRTLLEPGVAVERIQLTNCFGMRDWTDLLECSAFPYLTDLNVAGSDYTVTRIASALVAREDGCACKYLKTLVLTEEFVDDLCEDWMVLTEMGEPDDYVDNGGNHVLFAYAQIFNRLPHGFEMVPPPAPVDVYDDGQESSGEEDSGLDGDGEGRDMDCASEVDANGHAE